MLSGGDDEPKSTKKARKTEPNGTSVVNLHALADVGDASLARSGKPIVKDLFKSHADMSSMTDSQVIQCRLCQHLFACFTCCILGHCLSNAFVSE